MKLYQELSGIQWGFHLPLLLSYLLSSLWLQKLHLVLLMVYHLLCGATVFIIEQIIDASHNIFLSVNQFFDFISHVRKYEMIFNNLSLLLVRSCCVHVNSHNTYITYSQLMKVTHYACQLEYMYTLHYLLIYLIYLLSCKIPNIVIDH